MASSQLLLVSLEEAVEAGLRPLLPTEDAEATETDNDICVDEGITVLRFKTN